MTTEVASPEAELFATTSRTFLDREVPLTAVRQLHTDGVSFRRDWWQRAAELGWTSLLVPEDLGGGCISDNGLADLALIARHMGSNCAPGRPIRPSNTGSPI
jgi:alkylation response protein AidB-like acyl-CoA dehydrogenase